MLSMIWSWSLHRHMRTRLWNWVLSSRRPRQR